MWSSSFEGGAPEYPLPTSAETALARGFRFGADGIDVEPAAR
jgi:hypothetical protein